MENSLQGTFFAYDQPLAMREALPMFSYLGLSENEIALFFGMRPESPYAEKYIANEAQELNHLQLYASRSMDQVITQGINKWSREQFRVWIHSPSEALGNRLPKDLLLDVNEHGALLDTFANDTILGS